MDSEASLLLRIPQGIPDGAAGKAASLHEQARQRSLCEAVRLGSERSKSDTRTESDQFFGKDSEQIDKYRYEYQQTAKANIKDAERIEEDRYDRPTERNGLGR